MFLVNKYTERYNSIVHKAKNRKLVEGVYYEKHHILPKSMGGKNNKCNLVNLTPKEHYVVHHLLTKMCEGDNSRKMNYAFWKLNIRYKDEKRTNINFSTFEKIREKQKENMSKTMTGRFVSEKARESVRNSNRLRVGDKHPLFGKKRPNHVIEASRKANLGNKYCLGRKVSEETRKKMSESQKNVEKFDCGICGRKISGKGNFTQHTRSHKI